MLTLVQTLWFELTLFAAFGFLVFGIDDLVVDLLWLMRRSGDQTLPPDRTEGSAQPKLAIFVPAWREAAVIAQMIALCREHWAGQDYWLFIGTYPNDPATQAQVAACGPERVTMVTVAHDGATTKADCLNAIWATFQRHREVDPSGWAGIVLHDAEDLADPDELRVYRIGLTQHDLVQIPVLPLPNPTSLWVGGHYLDEFAESHGKDMLVRSGIGASLPLAGVGCALSLPMMDALHHEGGGRPFDAASLTEDYEMGLRIAALGRKGAFLRYRSASDGRLIGVRAYFPDTLGTAVRQKTRWVIGIALAGWDRVGWTPRLAEIWMRWRDRRSILAAILTSAGYLALVLMILIWMLGGETLISGAFRALLAVNTLLLCWRLTMRFVCVQSHHGWAEAFRSVPRALVSSVIAIMASRRAVFQYARSLQSGILLWDKTDHHLHVRRPS